MFLGSIPVADGQAALVVGFLDGHDFSPNTRRAFVNDLRKFAAWFTTANKEPFAVGRVTVRDVTDFRTWLRQDQGQATATVNRCLVTMRRFFAWLLDQGHVKTNPAKKVKELRHQALAPKGMERANVRRLLREVELRNDVRANAIFNMFLYTGGRCSDLANLELPDLMISERTGAVVFVLARATNSGVFRSPCLPDVRWRHIWKPDRPWLRPRCSSVNAAR
jgi:site-specific recombinase XerD